jgi:multisubunit Na+/H+ antiporter MnhB subunit
MSKGKAKSVLSIVVSLLIFVGFLYILSSEPFPVSERVHNRMIPVESEPNIGGAMSEFLWNFRGIDLLFQTIVLFTTAICCLALLREEEMK